MKTKHWSVIFKKRLSPIYIHNIAVNLYIYFLQNGLYSFADIYFKELIKTEGKPSKVLEVICTHDCRNFQN